MFYESGLDAKCEIIETMRMFMLNLVCWTSIDIAFLSYYLTNKYVS